MRPSLLGFLFPLVVVTAASAEEPVASGTDSAGAPSIATDPGAATTLRFDPAGFDAQAQGELGGDAAPERVAPEVRLGIGMSLPTFDTTLADRFTPGYSFAGEVGARTGRWHATLGFGYARLFMQQEVSGLVADEAEEPAPGDPDESPTLGLFELFANARFDLLDSEIRPYVLGGGGIVYESPSGGAERQQGLEDRVVPALQIGAGATETSGPFGIFLQARMALLIRDESVAPVTMVSAGAEL